jgi:isopentenyl phosphate kinase
MLLIKLGGSIITNKERPLSPRKKAIDKIAKQLRKIEEPIVIVHGGGSFGHYWSVKCDIHTKPAYDSARGVSVVKNFMVDLNKIVLGSFLKNKLYPYCLAPAEFMVSNKPINTKIKESKSIAKSGLIPITFGDALWYDQKNYTFCRVIKS